VVEVHSDHVVDAHRDLRRSHPVVAADIRRILADRHIDHVHHDRGVDPRNLLDRRSIHLVVEVAGRKVVLGLGVPQGLRDRRNAAVLRCWLVLMGIGLPEDFGRRKQRDYMVQMMGHMSCAAVVAVASTRVAGIAKIRRCQGSPRVVKGWSNRTLVDPVAVVGAA